MRLDILIENMGRVNFGTEMEYERKGMTGFETGGNRHLTDWTIRCLPLSDISSLKFGPCHGPSTEPGFFHGTFEAEYSRDLFLKNPCGTRGCVWVNGFNIGRYWNIGPQHTLYIPAPLVKSGKNELVVFDTNGLYHTSLSFSSERLIGPMSNMILEKE